MSRTKSVGFGPAPGLIVMSAVCLALQIDSSVAAGVVAVEFTADMYRVDASGATVTSGAGAYGVFDVYATFNQGGIRLLNIYDMTISLSSGDFVHNDADSGGGGNGRWNAQYDALGAVVGADSFVTMGTASTPNAATLDPNFTDTGSALDARSIAANAGWYSADPAQGWGDVDGNFKVFLGRFVIDDAGNAAGVSLSFGGSLAYNFQVSGAPQFLTDTQVFTMPDASGSIAVPGASGLAILAGLGLASGRRRQR